MVLALATAFACGGRTAGSGAGDDGGTPGAAHDGSASGSDAHGTIDAVGIVDSPIATADGPIVGDDESDGSPGLTCVGGPSAGSGGQGSCEVSVSETCSDGQTYTADCSCPAGTCSCSIDSSMGSSSGGASPFAGCPACPSPTAAFQACNFPP